jgi:hypothetical protein
MLMNSRILGGAGTPLARRIAEGAGAAALAVRRLYRAIRQCRDIAALAQLDDHRLTRSGLGEVIEPPSWRAPLSRAGTDRMNESTSGIKRWRSGEDKNRRALAELDEDELSNLSELGLQVRREARRRARER